MCYSMPMILNIDPVTILGLVAGAFTTVSFVPQVVRTWRVKSASDLSLAIVGLNSTGIFLWFVYGIYTRSLPIIIANLITFVLITTVLVLAIRYR
jgi:MtN3 and saliva related transmembrane protein